MTLIHTAQITTIDGFCSYVIRNYFHLIGLDPGYRTADEGELKLLQEDGQDVHYFPSFEEIKDFVKAHVKGQDLLITMGAGNLVEIGEELLAEK